MLGSHKKLLEPWKSSLRLDKDLEQNLVIQVLLLQKLSPLGHKNQGPYDAGPAYSKYIQ